MLAAQFAEKHGLNADLIHRAEMRNEIARAQDFTRINELIEKIGDVDFLADMAAEVKNLALKKALLEFCTENKVDDDEFAEDVSQTALEELDSMKSTR